MTNLSPHLNALNNLRVLVVEDQFFIADEICTLLRDWGARVIGPAGDVNSAQAMVNGAQPDVALLDVYLGAETVYPLAERLHAARVPCALLTGSDTDSIDSRFRDWPRLEKPFRTDTLATLMHRLLHGEIPETV